MKTKRVVALNPTERSMARRRRRRATPTRRRRSTPLTRRRRRRRNPVATPNPRRRQRATAARPRRRKRRRNPLATTAANPVRRRRRARTYRRNPMAGGKLTTRNVGRTLTHLAAAGATAAVATSVVEYWLDNLAGRALENGWLDGVSGGDPERAAAIAAWGGDALQLLLGGIVATAVAPRVKNRGVRAGLEYGIAFGAMTRMVKRAMAMTTTPASEPTSSVEVPAINQQAVGALPQVADDIIMLPHELYDRTGYNGGEQVEGWMWDGDELVGTQSLYDAGSMGL